MNKFSLIILFTTIIYGCDINNERVNGCGKSKVVHLTLIAEDIANKYDQENPIENDRQQLFRSAIIDSIIQISQYTIISAGGVTGSDFQLLNPCYPISQYYDYFESYKENSIKPLYDSLDHTDIKSEKFVKQLDKNFYSQNPYFDKDYFTTQRIEQLASDLITLELSLIY